jgi:ferric-dicitrate binding protein FerR (iron transport regulator)
LNWQHFESCLFLRVPARSITASRFSILIAVVALLSILIATPASAQEVGSVTRVQKLAQIGSATAAEGTAVHLNDRVRTGVGARLEITFRDDTKLTLGENAEVVVDRYVYNPSTSTGVVLLNSTRGALRFATGQISNMTNKDIKVQTPVAAAAVRGTEFWAGIVDHTYGILLLSDHGKVNVSNPAGSVLLSVPGQGTDIEPSLKEDQRPGEPYIWPADKVARALSQTSFGTALLGPIPGLAVPLIPLIPAITNNNENDHPISP